MVEGNKCKVSVNIVTWNSDNEIENCLYSLFTQTFKNFSVLVIDNGSEDRTLDLIKKGFPK